MIELIHRIMHKMHKRVYGIRRITKMLDQSYYSKTDEIIEHYGKDAVH